MGAPSLRKPGARALRTVGYIRVGVTRPPAFLPERGAAFYRSAVLTPRLERRGFSLRRGAALCATACSDSVRGPDTLGSTGGVRLIVGVDGRSSGA